MVPNCATHHNYLTKAKQEWDNCYYQVPVFGLPCRKILMDIGVVSVCIKENKLFLSSEF